MNNAFNGASGFNQNLGGWKTASVTDMGSMFSEAASFNQNLAAWNVLGVTNFASMFDGTTALADCYKRSVYNSWGPTLQAAYPTWGSLSMCTPRCENGWAAAADRG